MSPQYINNKHGWNIYYKALQSRPKSFFLEDKSKFSLNWVACERTLPHTIQNAAPVVRKNPATGSNKMWFIYVCTLEGCIRVCPRKKIFLKQISLQHLVDIKLCFDILMQKAEPSGAKFDNFWQQFLITFGNFWYLLATFGIFWQLLAIFSIFWYLLAAFDKFWQLLATFDKFWQILANFGKFLPLVAIFDNF